MKILNLNAGKILKIAVIFIFSAFFCQSIYSQFYWQKTYHAIPDGDEEFFDVCEADNNNYYIVGITAPGFRYGYVVKITEYGDTIWTKKYSFIGEIYTVAPTSDGGCIFAGYTGQAFACRINSNGDTLWFRQYNTINFQDIKKTLDGNYILCGANYSNGHYNGYACLIDINGNLLWEKIYPAIFTLDLIRVELALDGGYIIGGTQKNNTNGPETAYICKINDIGSIVWEKNYNNFNFNFNIVSGIQTCNEGYILTVTASKLWTLKINTNGDSLRSNIYPMSDYMYMASILKISENKYCVAHGQGIIGDKSFIYIIDSTLNPIRFLNIQNNEGVYIMSSVKVQNSIINDVIFVGITAYEPGNEEGYAIRIDTALTPPPPIGIHNNFTNTVTEYYLEQNFPNPFNGSTVIKFTVNKSNFVQIKIFDVLGREVETLVTEVLTAGIYSKTFSPKNLASGMYFYTLETNGYKDVKKMVLLK